MFKLSRFGKNVPGEIQRWQYFLLRAGVPQTGILDGLFGANTELATKIFQMQYGLSEHGRVDESTLIKAQDLGYVILDDDYYKTRGSTSWPKKPNSLRSPNSQWNNENIGCFEFRKASIKGDPSIIVKGSCDGTSKNWEDDNIFNYPDDRLRFAAGYNGYLRCNQKAWPYFKALLDEWDKASHLHLILNYAGAYNARYKKIKSNPPPGPHGTKRSSSENLISNHSYGSTIDISTTWNWIGDTPSVCGQRGSIRELVSSANDIGFYWGGHYSNADGMHFELARL